MDEYHFKSERPPDERWWQRELTRNEKLMDKYLSVFHQNPEWFKNHPEDLYYQVHLEEGFACESDEEDEEEIEAYLVEEDDEFSAEEWEEEVMEIVEEEESVSDDENSRHYPQLARQAHEFAMGVFDLKDLPVNADVLYLSAGKIGSNLAGGHGLGYDEDTICGNIVKCRWALADCHFCSEMLEHALDRQVQQNVAGLLTQSRQLETAIQDRIERLRSKVWW